MSTNRTQDTCFFHKEQSDCASEQHAAQRQETIAVCERVNICWVLTNCSNSLPPWETIRLVNPAVIAASLRRGPGKVARDSGTRCRAPPRVSVQRKRATAGRPRPQD